MRVIRCRCVRNRGIIASAGDLSACVYIRKSKTLSLVVASKVTLQNCDRTDLLREILMCGL